MAWQYSSKVTEWLAAGRPSAPLIQADISVAELAAQYWNHVRRRYVKNGKPTSERALVKMALAPVRELYGRTVVINLNRIRRFL